MAKKNKHLDHVEDTIIIDGTSGGENAIDVMNQVADFLSGKGGPGLKVTTKYDGAPAIFAGTDPSDGRFFVGTKSVFAKDSKLMKSEQDIRGNYNGALAEKLLTSFNLLKTCNIKGVLQGDLMFTNDKSRTKIDGVDYITFRPNTITYAVDPKTKTGSKINNARLGIIFHTKYSGATIPEMSASFNVSDSDFTSNAQVWAQKAEYTDIGNTAYLSGAERSKFDSALNRARGSLRQTKGVLDIIQSGKKALEIDTEFLKFFNNYVKAGKQIPSVDKAFNDYFLHLGKEYDKVITKYKTLDSQSKKAYKFIETIEFIGKYESEFKMIIATYMNLQFCKHILVDKMSKVKQLNLFVDRGGGKYDVTNDEGYVAISNDRAVKLIDRLEFSRLNFTLEKIW